MDADNSAGVFPLIWLYAVIILGALAVLEMLATRRLLVPSIAGFLEKAPAFRVTLGKPDRRAQPVEFRTSDGLTLRGSVWNGDQSEATGLVIYLPEMEGNHWMAPQYCAALIDEGYALFSFDFRGQGESDRPAGYSASHWMTELEMRDISAAMDFIESHPRLSTLPILVFGVSRGGVGALLTGARYPKVRGVIADSAFGTLTMIRFFADRFADLVLPRWLYRLVPNWHVERTLRQAMAYNERRKGCRFVHLEDEVSGLESESVLLISGTADTYVSGDVAARLHRLVGAGAKHWIVAGARHNMARSVHQGEYDRRICEHAAVCLQPAVISVDTLLRPGAAAVSQAG
jgi:pimeloyl-ACP methyl ester carboxylesterase